MLEHGLETNTVRPKFTGGNLETLLRVSTLETVFVCGRICIPGTSHEVTSKATSSSTSAIIGCLNYRKPHIPFLAIHFQYYDRFFSRHPYQ